MEAKYPGVTVKLTLIDEIITQYLGGRVELHSIKLSIQRICKCVIKYYSPELQKKFLKLRFCLH
jgi:hypothetical protein